MLSMVDEDGPDDQQNSPKAAGARSWDDPAIEAADRHRARRSQDR
jgi:hypothetical protein